MAVACVEKRGQERALVIGERRAADFRVRVGAADGARGVLVVARVLLGREPAGAAAHLAYVGLVEDLPVDDGVLALGVVVPDHRFDEALPLGVVGGFGLVLVVDVGVERRGLDADGHEGLGAGGEDGVDGLVEAGPVEAAALGIDAEVFLDEEADDARPEPADFVDVRGDHRVRGEAALAEGEAVDGEGAEVS